MEAGVFPNRKVREAFENYVVVHIYCDGEREVRKRNQELERRLVGTVAQPIYAVFDPETETLLKQWAWSPAIMSDPTVFAGYLDDGLEIFRRRRGK